MNKKYILLSTLILALLIPITLFVIEATTNPPKEKEVPPYETCETLDQDLFYTGVCVFGLKNSHVCEFYTIIPNTWRIPVNAPRMTYQPFFVKTPDMAFSEIVDCAHFRAYNASTWGQKNQDGPKLDLAFEITYTSSEKPENEFSLTNPVFFKQGGELTITKTSHTHMDAIQYDVNNFELGDFILIGADPEKEIASFSIQNISLSDSLFLRQFHDFDKAETVTFTTPDWVLTFKKTPFFF